MSAITELPALVQRTIGAIVTRAEELNYVGYEGRVFHPVPYSDLTTAQRERVTGVFGNNPEELFRFRDHLVSGYVVFGYDPTADAPERLVIAVTDHTSYQGARDAWTSLEVAILGQSAEEHPLYTFDGSYTSRNGEFPIRMDQPARVLPVMKKLETVLLGIPDADAPRGGSIRGGGFGNTNHPYKEDSLGGYAGMGMGLE